MNALLLGATGLIGKHLLAQLENDVRYTRVIVLARREAPGSLAPKVVWRQADFDLPTTYTSLQASQVDVIFCCLGSTMKQAGSKEAFRKVDFDYPMKVAETFKDRAADIRFVLVSSIGASSKSGSFYLRMKGELEDALAAVGFKSLEVFQPSFLIGERPDARGAEDVFTKIAAGTGPLFFGPLQKFRAVSGRDVAKAMARVATQAPKGPRVVHRYAEIGNLNM